jgi:iron complex transport system ATP-binding protein
MAKMLKLDNISFQIGKKCILNDINLSFEPGRISMILGPNGSGKSSLLKIFSGAESNFNGKVYYDGIDLTTISNESLAKKRAVLSQQSHLQFPLQVKEVVMMGRYPHFSFQPTKQDEEIYVEVISKLKLNHLQNRNYLTLSGGEKQRVHFARVLAQLWSIPENENRYLFLDEPLNSLDINFQQEFGAVAAETLGQSSEGSSSDQSPGPDQSSSSDQSPGPDQSSGQDQTLASSSPTDDPAALE